jgi:hypothetical protein
MKIGEKYGRLRSFRELERFYKTRPAAPGLSWELKRKQLLKAEMDDIIAMERTPAKDEFVKGGKNVQIP